MSSLLIALSTLALSSAVVIDETRERKAARADPGPIKRLAL